MLACTQLHGSMPVIDCPTCKGTGKDPKKRNRRCPSAAFCRGGKVDPDGMCDCICHDDGASVMHFMECCTYCYLKRSDLKKVLAEATDAA